MGNRHDVIPAGYWTYMGTGMKLLDEDLTALEAAVTYPLAADLRAAVGPDNPVTDTSAVTLTGVTPGTWTVGVTVVDPAGYLAPMRLANDNGSTAGVYPVGSITIT